MKVKGKITDVNLDYVLHKPKITIQLENQEDLLTDNFEKLRKEERLEVVLEKYYEKRGLQANKYFHKQINQLARYERGSGHAISDDEMKKNINLQYGTIATDGYGRIFGAKVPHGTDMQHFYPYSKMYKTEDGCDCYIFYKRTSELNTREMSQLIKGLDVECMKVGIETLEEKKFKKMMEEYEREYQSNVRRDN